MCDPLLRKRVDTCGRWAPCKARARFTVSFGMATDSCNACVSDIYIYISVNR